MLLVANPTATRCAGLYFDGQKYFPDDARCVGASRRGCRVLRDARGAAARVFRRSAHGVRLAACACRHAVPARRVERDRGVPFGATITLRRARAPVRPSVGGARGRVRRPAAIRCRSSFRAIGSWAAAARSPATPAASTASARCWRSKRGTRASRCSSSRRGTGPPVRDRTRADHAACRHRAPRSRSPSSGARRSSSSACSRRCSDRSGSRRLRVLIAGIALALAHSSCCAGMSTSRRTGAQYLFVGVLNSALPFLLFAYAALHLARVVSRHPEFRGCRCSARSRRRLARRAR